MHHENVRHDSIEPHPEKVVAERGPRSGQMITISIDSTGLGPALGGCRIKSYPSWQHGLADAVRLSSAMTDKAALAGLAHGGGKTVVTVDDSFARDRSHDTRADLLADIGDLVEGLHGDYVTGPDIGSGPADMVAIGERTSHVLCRPESAGGSGDSSGPTALGVNVSIDAVCRHLWPDRDLSTLRFAVHGLGHVGALVASRLAGAGVRLTVTDVDASKRQLANDWGATWIPAEEAMGADVDVVVPCAVGGILRTDNVPDLQCAAVVGAANNQLDHDTTADLLHKRGIIWAPDPVVSGGGIISSVSREREGATPEQADARVRGIGRRLAQILSASASAGTTPLYEARQLTRHLLDELPTRPRPRP